MKFSRTSKSAELTAQYRPSLKNSDDVPFAGL